LKELSNFKELFRKYGSIDFVKRYTENLLKKAVEDLKKKIPDSESRKN
jgi:geranylgeranyl pyrophosphate synthase